jgi:3-methyladenine DNA glycosylase/8-oxoguanine DNA glycosylase
VTVARVLTTFTPTPPYHFPALLELIRRHPAPTLDIAAGTTYRRVFAQGDHLALVEANLTPKGSVYAPQPPTEQSNQALPSLRSGEGLGEGIKISLLTQSGAIDEAQLIQQVAHVLAIESPQRAALCSLIQNDARLQAICAPLIGLPMLRAETLFEALICVIIEQQIAWRAAVKAQRWLLEWGGRYLDYEGQRYYAFPTPQQLATATTDDLKPLKITFKRIELIRHLAGKYPLPEFADIALSTPNDTYHALLKIKGIGHWTAAVITQRVHGTSPFVADNDVALQAAVGRYFYDRTGKVSQQEVSATFAPYGEHGGDAAFYTLVRWVFDEYPVVSE